VTESLFADAANDFCNKIGTKRQCGRVALASAVGANLLQNTAAFRSWTGFDIAQLVVSSSEPSGGLIDG
jgi:hypothetical protein